MKEHSGDKISEINKLSVLEGEDEDRKSYRVVKLSQCCVLRLNLNEGDYTTSLIRVASIQQSCSSELLLSYIFIICKFSYDFN